MNARCNVNLRSAWYAFGSSPYPELSIVGSETQRVIEGHDAVAHVIDNATTATESDLVSNFGRAVSDRPCIGNEGPTPSSVRVPKAL